MKQWLKYTIAAVGCLTGIFLVVCITIRFGSENDKSHYGTVHRSKTAEQKTEGITRYFFTTRGWDENSFYCYYSEKELTEAGSHQDWDDYCIWFPQGMEETKEGKSIVRKVKKEIARWKKKEPSFQGCEVIKEKHTLHELPIEVWMGEPVNGIVCVVYQKVFYYGSSDEPNFYRDIDICGYTEVEIKNYDINTGRELKLADLFYEDTDYVGWLEDYLLKTGQFHTDDRENGILATKIDEDTQFVLVGGQLYIVPEMPAMQGVFAFSILEFEEELYEVSGVDMMEYSALGSYRDDSKYAVTECICGDVDSLLGNYTWKVDAEQGNREFVVGNGKTEEYEFIWNCPAPEEIRQSIRENYSESVLYMNEDEYLEIEHAVDEEGCLFKVKTRYTLGRVGNLYVMTVKQGIGLEETDSDKQWDICQKLSEAAGNTFWNGVTQTKCYDTEGNPVTVWDIFRDPEEAPAVVADLAFQIQKESVSAEEWKEYVKTAEIIPTYRGLQISDESTIPWDDLIQSDLF